MEGMAETSVSGNCRKSVVSAGVKYGLNAWVKSEMILELNYSQSGLANVAICNLMGSGESWQISTEKYLAFRGRRREARGV